MLDYALQWVDKPASGESKEFELLFIRTNIGFKKIATEAISHLEASGSYCEIHITDGSMMLVSIPLSEVVKMLSPDRFLRIHRGFSINLLHIDMLVGNTLIMVGGKKLPIGREHRKSVIGQFTLVGTKSRKYMP